LNYRAQVTRWGRLSVARQFTVKFNSTQEGRFPPHVFERFYVDALRRAHPDAIP
jgi:hypothetical protein